MKKILVTLADGVLSREQMKTIVGGYDEAGSCTATCPSTPGAAGISCTSTSGNCSKSAAHETQQWIKCE